VGELVGTVGVVTVEARLVVVPPAPEMLEGEVEFAHVLPLASSFTIYIPPKE